MCVCVHLSTPRTQHHLYGFMDEIFHVSTPLIQHHLYDFIDEISLELLSLHKCYIVCYLEMENNLTS